MRALITPYWTRRGIAADLWRDMDRFFDEFTNSPNQTEAGKSEFLPATEVTEDEQSYQLSIDLPGMKMEDIKVEVHDNQLSVCGERKREQKTDESKVQRFERTYGYFRRQFTLPKDTASDKIEARYANGVLELVIPKAELTQARKIEIQAPKN